MKAIDNERAATVINRVGVGISLLLIIYAMYQLGNTKLMRAIMGGFGIYIDLLAQYFWGLSFALAKEKRRGVFGLRFAYGIYIACFVILSAIGVFMAEINTTEEEYQAVQNAKTQVSDQYKEYTAQITTLIAQGKEEKIRGPKAKDIENQITELRGLRATLPSSETVTKSSESPVKKVRTTFQSLHEVLKLPENFFKVIMFGAAMLMLCLGNAVTPWKVSLKVTESKTQIAPPVQAAPPNITPALEVAATVPDLQPLPTPVPVSNIDEFMNFASEAIRESRILNSNLRVSEKTGIPLDRCTLYRTLLDNMRINGQPVVTVQEGDSKTYRPSVANFHKDIILEHIKTGNPG